MKKLTLSVLIIMSILLSCPAATQAASGIFPNGSGTKTVGKAFTANIVASGAEFNAFQGTISVSGPATASITAGSADTWMSKPSIDGTFSGALLGRKVTSLTIATVTLKGTSPGKVSLSVSGVILKDGATTVGTSGGTASFTIQKAAELPGSVSVTSDSHPDQNTSYEATTAVLSWVKASGVDGFSYLLDESGDTNPEPKIKDSGSSASYENISVGVHYFHIRAHKPDGWGPVTHFKITVKEPDPKINESLTKPVIREIKRVDNAANNIDNGTLAGIEITGKTEPGFTANIIFSPALKLPEGKSTSIVSGAEGDFRLLIDWPLPAGFYKITAQGQKEKVLTPIGNSISFEISLKQGGQINLITDSDVKPPVITSNPVVKGSFLRREYPIMSYLIFTLILALLTLAVVELFIYIKKRRGRNYSRV